MQTETTETRKALMAVAARLKLTPLEIVPHCGLSEKTIRKGLTTDDPINAGTLRLLRMGVDAAVRERDRLADAVCACAE